MVFLSCSFLSLYEGDVHRLFWGFLIESTFTVGVHYLYESFPELSIHKNNRQVYASFGLRLVLVWSGGCWSMCYRRNQSLRKQLRKLSIQNHLPHT